MEKKAKKKIIESLHHVPSLRKTLARMLTDGRISPDKEAFISTHLDEWVVDSKLILINLGVHIGMAFIRFAAIPPLLPIGTFLRPLWVAANRLYCDIKWDMHRKKIHSLAVFFFSAIPFLGYFAYTIPLKQKSEYLAYLYAQHISYELYNKTLEEKLKNAPGIIKKIAYALLVPGEVRKWT